jgi:hypothetical protein
MGTRTIQLMAICAAIILLSASTAGAIYVEGNELHENCSASTEFKEAACVSYIIGITDFIDLSQAAGDARLNICIPDRATAGQVIDVVKTYIDRNPKERHLAAVLLVTNALSEAFPCP